MTSATRKITPNQSRAAGRDSSVERIVHDCIHRIKSREVEVRAFVQFDPDGALAQARALDALPPTQRGPLHGMPFAIKEVFDVRGLRCPWGTPIHINRVPETDAVVVAALREAGAVIMGTTVSTEYALAATGPTRNPWDSSRTPGASSSGPAAAVGAGMVPAALGSQTIGSIIRPAAYCGIFGFKPTWGSINDTGAMRLSEALDHVGILASGLEDLRSIFSVLRGTPDGGSVGKNIEEGPENIHVLRDAGAEAFSPTALAAINRAADVFKSRGCNVSDMTLGAEFADCDAILRTILCRDMSHHHGDDFDGNGHQMSERVRTMIKQGRKIGQAEYRHARERSAALIASLQDMIGLEDIVLTGSTIDVAPRLEKGTGSRAPQLLWTLAGMPTITVPCGFVDGLPIGVQLVGVHGKDDLVLTTAEQLSKNLS